MKRAVNVLCLAGMVLALVPIAVSWVTTDAPSPLDGRHFSAVDIMAHEVHCGSAYFVISATIFTTATIFLLVSPLGSLFQIAGIGIFLIGAPYSVSWGMLAVMYTASAGIGIVVAGIAAALPLIGMLYPKGVTRDFRLVTLKERVITFGLTAE